MMSNILKPNSGLIFKGHISNEKASWKVVCPSETMVLTSGVPRNFVQEGSTNSVGQRTERTGIWGR
jgi:hypothetical protein